jgi:hypothetical protein
MELITGFIAKYFMQAALAVIVTVFTKVSLKYFGNDRTAKIKETILTAMLWAEETYGIGTGSEKWTAAWQKLTELLQVQGIKLNDKEMSVVSIQMKSNIPEINSLVYSALPEVSTIARAPDIKPTEMSKLVEKLRSKYPTQEE